MKAKNIINIIKSYYGNIYNLFFFKVIGARNRCLNIGHFDGVRGVCSVLATSLLLPCGSRVMGKGTCMVCLTAWRSGIGCLFWAILA